MPSVIIKRLGAFAPACSSAFYCYDERCDAGNQGCKCWQACSYDFQHFLFSFHILSPPWLNSILYWFYCQLINQTDIKIISVEIRRYQLFWTPVNVGIFLVSLIPHYLTMRWFIFHLAKTYGKSIKNILKWRGTDFRKFSSFLKFFANFCLRRANAIRCFLGRIGKIYVFLSSSCQEIIRTWNLPWWYRNAE